MLHRQFFALYPYIFYRAKPREEEELENIPTFRAKPVDRRVMESAGDIGVPRVERKPTTTPKPFVFSGEKKHKEEQERIARLREEKDKIPEAPATFRAQPFKAYVLFSLPSVFAAQS